MKTNRNYRFVLTVVPDSMLETGELTIAANEVTGERLFASECHYYAEKNIIEAIKAAEKDDRLSEYYAHTYCIYKENKSTVVTKTRTEGNKTISEVEEIPGEAMLVETITVDECGINIR